MANKKLQYEDIAEKNLLQPLIKQLEDVESRLKDIIKVGGNLNDSFKSFSEMEKAEKTIKNTTTAVKELDKVEKDRIKLQQRLKELEDDRVKANFELKEEIRLQTKELRDSAKEAKAVRDDYEELVKQTNEAQKSFKRLATQYGVNSQEAAKAKAEFEAFDAKLREVNEAAKDGRRDVGRYKTAYEELVDEVTDARKNLKEITTEFGKNSKEAKEARKELKKVSEQLESIEDSAKKAEQKVDSLGKTIKSLGIVALLVKGLELASDAFNNNTEGAASLEKLLVRLTTTIGVFVNRIIEAFPIIQARFERFVVFVQLSFAKLTNVMGSNEDKVKSLQKEYDELSKVADQDLTTVFAGMGEEISDLIDKKVALIDNTIKYRKEIIQLEKGIAANVKRQRELEAVSGDQTLSIAQQIEAFQELNKVNNIVLGNEIKIARLRFKLAADNAEANRANLEAQEEAVSALLELKNAEAELLGAQRDIAKEIAQLRDDQIQQNLDFYVDDFDNKKTVNERIIADETQTFEHRKELLAQNRRLSEESAELSFKEINESLRRQGKAEIDFTKLVNEESSKRVAEEVRAAGLSEQLGVRALEVIRERRTVLQDNAEAQRDLNKAEQESNDIKTDILLTDAAIFELQEKGVDVEATLERLSEKRLENDIKNLRTRLALAQQGSAEAININAELNEKLLEQNQNRINKELEAEKKKLEKQKQLQETAFAAVQSFVNKQFEKRLSDIDKELAAEQERANALQKLAAEGNEDAEKNLALNEKRQAELELEREKQLRRQQQSELALSAIQSYSSKVAANDPNPLASTIADITVLRSFIASLPAFYEGAERVGDELEPVLSGKDGHIIRVDGDERILNPKQNAMIPKSMSNMELALLASGKKITETQRESVYDQML